MVPTSEFRPSTPTIPIINARRAVRVGILSPITKLDPRDAVDYATAFVLRQVFETPYAAASGQAASVPVLFEPLRREDTSGLQYSAAIRPGIVFSDGTPLTPEIAVRSLRGSPVLARKTAIEVRGERIWFTLTVRNARFDLTLTQTSCSIVLDKGLQLLGTGPFMFDHRPNLRMMQSAPSISLLRNPKHAQPATTDEVTFMILPADADGTPRRIVEALRSGDIDVTTSVAASEIPSHQLTGLHPLTQPGSSTALLYFNVERRLTGNTSVRRGIAAALDLPSIAQELYARNPVAFVAGSALPPSMARGIGIPQTNRADAQRLIDASDARGAKLSLLIPWAPRPYLPKPKSAAENIRKQLAAVGLDVTIVQAPSHEEFFTMIYGGQFDMALAGWIADTPDPADFLEALLWSRAAGDTNHGNYGRWHHAPTDAALERYRVDPSDANRREIDRIIREEAPFVPLVYGQTHAIHTRRLRNLQLPADGLLTLSRVGLA